MRDLTDKFSEENPEGEIEQKTNMTMILNATEDMLSESSASQRIVETNMYYFQQDNENLPLAVR